MNHARLIAKQLFTHIMRFTSVGVKGDRSDCSDLGSSAERGKIDHPLDDRNAVTDFTAVSYDNGSDTATAAIRIRTGCLHQIRRHFNLIGHPVMRDPRYGRNHSNPAWLQLTAVSLSFDCPLGEGRIDVSIDERMTHRRNLKGVPQHSKSRKTQKLRRRGEIVPHGAEMHTIGNVVFRLSRKVKRIQKVTDPGMNPLLVPATHTDSLQMQCSTRPETRYI